MNLRDWWFRRRHREADLEEEIQGHLRMAAREHMDRGESPEEARVSAAWEFGNVTFSTVARTRWSVPLDP